MYAPDTVDLRETHRATRRRRRRSGGGSRWRTFRCWRSCSDGGAAVLATDRTGYLLPPKSGPHARDPRETLTVLPSDVWPSPPTSARFHLVGSPRTWEWLVTAPDATNFGRMYEAVGVVLRA